MLQGIIMAIVGALALLGVGMISFVYLGSEKEKTPQSPASVQPVPLDVVPQETPTVSTTIRVPIAPVVKQPPMSATVPAPANGKLVPKIQTHKEEAVTPGPLRVVTTTSKQTIVPTADKLSIQGVLEYTNRARKVNGELSALSENATLDRVAKNKLNDMFAKQYFEHVSPGGVGPSDLAQAEGYAYVLVGENLALGDFDSDEELVTAWMNSPGHRANILNAHYEEIGIAVGQGMYEGRSTWIAVQSFGMPLSACPAISSSLKSQIEVNNAEIAHLRAILDEKQALLNATPQYDPRYNTYVAEFNSVVSPYNALLETTRAQVVEYNAQVQAFNDCANSVGSHTM